MCAIPVGRLIDIPVQRVDLTVRINEIFCAMLHDTSPICTLNPNTVWWYLRFYLVISFISLSRQLDAKISRYLKRGEPIHLMPVPFPGIYLCKLNNPVNSFPRARVAYIAEFKFKARK